MGAAPAISLSPGDPYRRHQRQVSHPSPGETSTLLPQGGVFPSLPRPEEPPGGALSTREREHARTLWTANLRAFARARLEHLRDLRENPPKDPARIPSPQEQAASRRMIQAMLREMIARLEPGDDPRLVRDILDGEPPRAAPPLTREEWLRENPDLAPEVAS